MPLVMRLLPKVKVPVLVVLPETVRSVTVVVAKVEVPDIVSRPELVVLAKLAVPEKVGEAEKTKLPEPVSSDTEAARLAEVMVLVRLKEPSVATRRLAVRPEKFMAPPADRLEAPMSMLPKPLEIEPEESVPTVVRAEALVRLGKVSIADSMVDSVVLSKVSMFCRVRVPEASLNGIELPICKPALGSIRVPVIVSPVLKT